LTSSTYSYAVVVTAERSTLLAIAGITKASACEGIGRRIIEKFGRGWEVILAPPLEYKQSCECKQDKNKATNDTSCNRGAAIALGANAGLRGGVDCCR
jgi:hypothetical protein